ncbi:MAG: SHOCT domain-containing protein [Ilumatobacteraceae bacterium]
MEGTSTEDRLRELDDLLARGVITPEEHSEARRRALGG